MTTSTFVCNTDDISNVVVNTAQAMGRGVRKAFIHVAKVSSLFTATIFTRSFRVVFFPF